MGLAGQITDRIIYPRVSDHYLCYLVLAVHRDRLPMAISVLSSGVYVVGDRNQKAERGTYMYMPTRNTHVPSSSSEVVAPVMFVEICKLLELKMV